MGLPTLEQLQADILRTRARLTDETWDLVTDAVEQLRHAPRYTVIPQSWDGARVRHEHTGEETVPAGTFRRTHGKIRNLTALMLWYLQDEPDLLVEAATELWASESLDPDSVRRILLEPDGQQPPLSLLCELVGKMADGMTGREAKEAGYPARAVDPLTQLGCFGEWHKEYWGEAARWAARMYGPGCQWQHVTDSVAQLFPGIKVPSETAAERLLAEVRA